LRDDIYKKIQNMAIDQEKIKNERIEEFIEKGVQGRWKDSDAHTIHEKQKRESAIKEIAEFKQLQVLYTRSLIIFIGTISRREKRASTQRSARSPQNASNSR